MNRALYDCVFVSFRRGWSCYYVCVFCFGRYTVPFSGPSVPWRDEKRACFTRWLMPSVVDISHFLKKQHKKKMMWFVVLTVSFSYYRYYRSRERTARENTVFSGTSCRRPSPGRRDVRRERWRTTNTDRWCSWGCGVDGAFFLPRHDRICPSYRTSGKMVFLRRWVRQFFFRWQRWYR